jgi:hypothetical protein
MVYEGPGVQKFLGNTVFITNSNVYGGKAHLLQGSHYCLGVFFTVQGVYKIESDIPVGIAERFE